METQELKIQEAGEECMVRIAEGAATFRGEGETITVPKAEARQRIVFAGRTKVRVDAGEVNYTFKDKALKDALRAWLPKRTQEELAKELRKWGIGLIIVGGLHMALNDVLDPLWGILIIALGLTNLFIHKRAMLVVNGIVIMAAGLLNLFAGVGWTLFALLQFYWGIKEMRKCGEYERYSLNPSAVVGYNQAK